MWIAHHGHEFLDVNEADRVIEIFPAKRETRMSRFDCLFDVGFEAVFKVEINDFAAWCHDIAHNAIAQIERIDEQIASERGNFVRFFALLEDQSQLLFAVRQLRTGGGSHAQQSLQQQVRRFVQQPNCGPEQEIKQAEGAHDSQGDR